MKHTDIMDPEPIPVGGSRKSTRTKATIASLFEGQTDAIDIFDHDLTIRGLFEISKRLKAK